MIEKAVRIAAYVAVAAVCLVRVRSYVTSDHAGARTSPQAMAAKFVGTRVGVDQTSGSAPSDVTLVVAMTTSCVYCKASAPFYRRLLENVAPDIPRAVQTVAVMPEGKDRAADYLRDSLLLRFSSVVQDMPGLRVSATPTLLVVDREGIVRGAWVGMLDSSAEDEVVATLRNVAGKS
ncbi:MAG TPA: hypothetical protein VKV74_12175 [Bryobacteraceae bacterium]|nr:hypothetical protein [Bryobacteraceae bacterium]